MWHKCQKSNIIRSIHRTHGDKNSCINRNDDDSLLITFHSCKFKPTVHDVF